VGRKRPHHPGFPQLSGLTGDWWCPTWDTAPLRGRASRRMCVRANIAGQADAIPLDPRKFPYAASARSRLGGESARPARCALGDGARRTCLGGNVTYANEQSPTDRVLYEQPGKGARASERAFGAIPIQCYPGHPGGRECLHTLHELRSAVNAPQPLSELLDEHQVVHRMNLDVMMLPCYSPIALH
jgi:hypothetical protein